MIKSCGDGRSKQSEVTRALTRWHPLVFTNAATAETPENARSQWMAASLLASTQYHRAQLAATVSRISPNTVIECFELSVGWIYGSKLEASLRMPGKCIDCFFYLLFTSLRQSAAPPLWTQLGNRIRLKEYSHRMHHKRQNGFQLFQPFAWRCPFKAEDSLKPLTTSYSEGGRLPSQCARINGIRRHTSESWLIWSNESKIVHQNKSATVSIVSWGWFKKLSNWQKWYL